ncbi:hypothetical protein NVS89_22600 [Ancylobacter sp. MQZ15Z-1]|uniref:Uncharacterized protein n=1 Tax=Ancylobacter mangrovi TaxID=2972472 RepID=A0A9X2T3Z6_9HYPH|nr:hypothetical protein [Ancylobacter mangrovi]MCS0497885.1 hypothetical protein [Ancylobacter mangrovi]
MTEHSESRARIICAMDARLIGLREEDVAAFVERFWPVVANEINGGLLDLEEEVDADRIAELRSLMQEYRNFRR